jgi:hypothetical protein
MARFWVLFRVGGRSGSHIRLGVAEDSWRPLPGVGVDPIQGAPVIGGADPDSQRLRRVGNPEDPGVGTLDRSGVDRSRAVTDTHLDEAVFLQSHIYSKLLLGVGSHRRRRIHRIRVVPGAFPRDVGDLHRLDAGDDDVVGWIDTQGILTGRAATSDGEEPKETDAGEPPRMTMVHDRSI